MRMQTRSRAPSTTADRTVDAQIVASRATPAGVVGGGAPAPGLEACRSGMVLRAVVLVHLVVLAGFLLFGEPRGAGWGGWLLSLGIGAGCALPATLLWLMVLCALRPVLAGRPARVQWRVAVLAGGGCGWFAALLYTSVVETVPWRPWLGGMLVGAVLSWLLASQQLLRSRLRSPEDVAAQLAELQARIRPHFLFNALNSAIALVRVDPARAESVLEDLADLFRGMLRGARHRSTLAAELALAQRYLRVEEVRFGERLRVDWVLDPAAGLAVVPPLILQPLLENAIRHGVEPSDTGAAIRVRTQLRGNRVRIVLANTFPAGPGAPGNGMALENVRNRLALCHDMELRFSAKVVRDRFVVRIEVPMQIAAEGGCS